MSVDSTRKYAAFSLSAFAVFVVDRVSKLAVERLIEVGERVPVVEAFFYFSHVRNPGGAFGLFGDVEAETRVLAFAVATAAALLLILWFLRSLAPGDRIAATALGLVAGGALGNGLDRLSPFGDGQVIDFLNLRLWGGYPWPDFNIADVAIALGVLALIVELVVVEATARAHPQVGDSSS